MPKPHFGIKRFQIGRSLQALRIETLQLAVTVLLDQGADILELIHKPSGADVLWKTPQPTREPGIGPTPAGDSMAQWMNYYRGGWQTILPNFGPAVEYRGGMLDFHGEAARRPWHLKSELSDAAGSQIVVSTELSSVPLSIVRSITVSNRVPSLQIRETITNLSEDPIDCMWGHHPVFGAPLLGPEAVIYTGAHEILTDDQYDVPGNDLPLGATFGWPWATSRAGNPVDLSRIPAPGTGFSRVLFLKEFTETWYAIVNPAVSLGIGMRWNKDLMPFACFWQETGGVRGFPHFARSYTTALEPNTSYFGHGLIEAMEKSRTHLTLRPGESRTLDLTAVLFTDTRVVRCIGEQGEVEYAE